MFKIRLEKVAPLGDYSEQFGQRWWGKEEDSDVPISFNSHDLKVMGGDWVEAEEKTMKKSQKGTTYWQLKKVHVVHETSNSAAEAEKPVKSPVNASQSHSESAQVILSRIETKVDEALGKLDELLGTQDQIDKEIAEAEDEVPIDAYDEPPMPDDFLTGE